MRATRLTATMTWAIGSATASGTTISMNFPATYAVTVYVDITQVGTATTAATIQVQQSPTAMERRGIQDRPTTPADGGNYAWVLALDPTMQMFGWFTSAQSGGTSSTLGLQAGYVTGV